MKFIRTITVALLVLAGMVAAPIMTTSAQAQGFQVFELKPYNTIKQDLQTAVDTYVASIKSQEGEKLLADLEDSFAGIEKVKADYVALPNKDEAALDSAAQAWLEAFENMQAKMRAVDAHAPTGDIDTAIYYLNFYPFEVQSDRSAVEAILAPLEPLVPELTQAYEIQQTTYESAVPYVESMMEQGEQYSNDLAVKGMLMHFKAELTEAAGN